MKSSALRLGSAAALVCCLLPLLPAGRSPGAEPAAGPPVVFVVRVFEPSPGAPAGAVARAESGVLRLATHDGQAWRFADLVSSGPPPGAPGVPLDVADPDVSYDGMRIVFAGYLGSERAWRIFEVKADGTGLRQVTGSTRAADLSRYGEAATRFESYDDADPCYLPDGRICFVSTRYPGFSPGRRLQATNLYVVGSDGGGLRRITT
ncbi:MAG: hypothetical protein HY721_01985, partial [Planctomycetes bacterium]|nr:hypothetical protein [Planctomycetota bacterium]